MTLKRIVTVTNQPELQQMVREVGREIFSAENLNEALDITQTVMPDMILFDHQFDKKSLDEFIQKTDNAIRPSIVIVSDQESDVSDRQAHQDMNIQFINKDNKLQHLKKIVNNIKNPDNTDDAPKTETALFAEDWASQINLVGQSPAASNTLKSIKLVAKSRCNPILILGETGTGKELAAQAIHHLRHKEKPFVAVNCAALTASLLESELFGHVKGSFTGADRDKTGLMELAEDGTIFLDEISEMPLDLQAKLLRVLQEKTFRKVGGIKDLKCKATIVASSNRNLKNEVEKNKFRQDLYYRLNIFPISLAPLRSHLRKPDIPLLAEFFIKNSLICPDKKGKIQTLTKIAVETLQKYPWPGNVRELKNVIERAIILETTDKIGVSSILFDPENFYDDTKRQNNTNISDFSLEKAEKELIARALQETGWQKTRAAALLGITRATLYAKVKQHNIIKEEKPSNQLDSENLKEPAAAC